MDTIPEKQIVLNGTSLIAPILHILIVEDNPGDVIIVKELIKSSGINFNFSHAANLEETLTLCNTREFDALLLDLGLPGSTGLETLKRVLQFKLKSPIIVMTGLDDEDIALASLREGAQDYLVKNKLTSDYILRSIKYGIERKKIEELIKRHTHQFSVLSSATISITGSKDISSIYTIICENIRFLLDKANALTIEFENLNTIHTLGIEWLEPWIEKIKSLSGVDMNNPIFHLDGQENALLNQFKDGKLHEIKGGLYEIFEGKVDRNDCEELGKNMGFNNIYAIGITKGENYYGGTILFSQKIIDEDDQYIIETISGEASLNIHKKSIEKELRLSEDRYRKLSRELEEKVTERTKDLEFVNFQLHQELTERSIAQELLRKSEAQLKELNATKDKFFNIVAHDLKNPFTSLLGSTELLYENIHKLDSEEIRELAVILNDSAKSGYSILLNLLDWSRSQTGLLKINTERINLRELINENILHLQLPAANKEIYLYYEAEEDIYLFADKNMINTVLRNLLSNAVKFTYRCGKVIVGASLTTDEVIISVKDTGIGISKENIDKLFRIDTNYSLTGTDNERGTGLGLKLCKEFVEKQGGRIWVESIENQGSEFKFSLPVKKS